MCGESSCQRTILRPSPKYSQCPAHHRGTQSGRTAGWQSSPGTGRRRKLAGRTRQPVARLGSRPAEPQVGNLAEAGMDSLSDMEPAACRQAVDLHMLDMVDLALVQRTQLVHHSLLK